MTVGAEGSSRRRWENLQRMTGLMLLREGERKGDWVGSVSDCGISSARWGVLKSKSPVKGALFTKSESSSFPVHSHWLGAAWGKCGPTVSLGKDPEGQQLGPLVNYAPCNTRSKKSVCIATTPY